MSQANPMMQTALQLLSLCLAAPFTTTATSQATVLAVVPENCTALAYCDAPAALRERAEENAWFQLMNSQSGAYLLRDFGSTCKDQAGFELEEVYPIAKALRDETVLFYSPGVAGLFSRAPEPRNELREALNQWLPEGTSDLPRKQMQVGQTRIELIAWPANGQRQGHFAAFVEHPQAMGLLSADNLELLVTALEDAAGRLGTEHMSPITHEFLSARATAQSTRGIEFYVDLSAWSEDAEVALKRATEGAFPDPTGMLGLEKDVWMHANLDLHRGRRIDSSGFLHIPQKTLLAELADTFAPLPADFSTRLPRDLECLWGLQWNLEEFYRRVRTGFIKRHGEESLAQVDAGLDAAKQMVGVDPVDDLVASLDGTWSFFFGQSDEGEPEDRFVETFGAMLGLQDSDRFLSACEALIDATLQKWMDLEDINGADVYTVRRAAAEDLFPQVSPGGFAFAPREFLLSLNGDRLRAHLDAIQQNPEASLAMNGQIGPLLDEFRGTTYFAAARLGWLDDMRSSRRHELAPRPEVLKPFLGAFVVQHASRIPGGFTFGMEVR